MKKKIVLIFLGILFLALPQTAAKAYGIVDLPTRISAMDTIAGFGSVVKVTSVPAEPAIFFTLIKPNGDTVTFTQKSSDDGTVTLDIPEMHTRKAGTYTVMAGNSKTSFTVLPDEPSAELSRIYTDHTEIPADGSQARITVRVQDRFGNPIHDSRIALLSSRSEDSVAVVNDVTDEEGTAVFLISSTKTGVSTLTALDQTSGLSLEHRATITFTKMHGNRFGFGGDDFMANSFLALADVMEESNTASLQVSGLPENIFVNETISFDVTAKKQDGSLDTEYAGTVKFTTTDANAVLPNPYTFQPADLGKHTFELSVSFKTVGSQRFVATDTAEENVTGFVEIDVEEARSAATTPTEVVITKPTSGTYGTNVLEIEGTATPQSTVTLFDNGRSMGTTRTSSAGTFSYTTAPLNDGEHALYAESEGEIAEEVMVTIDATPAAVNKIEVTPNPVAPGENVTITMTSDPGLESVSAIFGDVIVQLSQGRAPNDDTFTGTVTAPSATGSYPVDVLLIDAQGNESSFAEAATLAVDENLQQVDVAFHVPSRVAGVVSTPGSGRVNLTWNAAADDTGIAFYRIYYGIDRNNLNSVVNTFDAGTAWYLPGLQNGVQYFFQVVGVDDENNEGDQRSAVVSAIPDGSFFGVPEPSPVSSELGVGGAPVVGPPATLPEDGPGMLGILIPFLSAGISGIAIRVKRKLK